MCGNMCVYSPWANTVWVWVTAERKQSRVYTHACFFFLSFPFFFCIVLHLNHVPGALLVVKGSRPSARKSCKYRREPSGRKGLVSWQQVETSIQRGTAVCTMLFSWALGGGGLIKHISQTHTLKEILPVSLTQMGVKFSLWIMNCVGAEGEKHWNHLNLIHHAYTNTCTVSYSNGLPLKG